VADQSQYYVDPSGGDDTTGTGTVGAPWKTVQHALDTITRDTADGDAINIRDTADDVLTAALSLTTYGAPSAGSPLTFRGYSTSAKDGGIGGISGGGSYQILSTLQYVEFIDMHLHNTGSNAIVSITYFGVFINCEFDNTTDNGFYSAGYIHSFHNCHFHNIGDHGIQCNGAWVKNCYFKNDGSNDFSAAIQITNFYEAVMEGNIISVDGTSDGIYLGTTNYLKQIRNNSIYSNGGTGQGIIGATSTTFSNQIANNLIEGFSGTGGIGMDLANAAGQEAMIVNNSVYNCATTANLNQEGIIENDMAESLGSSPFAKSGSDTFANRYTYFSPLDVGNVFNGSYKNPSLHRGAVQIQDTGGGGADIATNSGRIGIMEA